MKALADRLHLSTILFFLVVLFVWSLISRKFGSYVMPSPKMVVLGFGTIISSGALWDHTYATLWRILFGFSGALLIAIIMGMSAYLWRTANTVVNDLVAILNSTSVFVWIVVSLIWFGLTDLAPIFTTLMITLPVLAANVVEGVQNVDKRQMEMAFVYKLSPSDQLRHVVIPSTIPYLVAGMKVGFGLALKVSVVAEIFGVTSGIGYIMNYSREILATDMVFVWAGVMIMVMIIVDKLVFETVSKRVERWR